MDTRDLAFVGCRLVALYFGVQAVELAAAVLGAHDMATRPAVGLGISAAASICLWTLAQRVAGLIARPARFSLIARVSRDDIQQVLFAAVGLFIFVDAAADLCETLYIRYASNRRGFDPHALVAAAKTVIGFLLVLGSSVLVGALERWAPRRKEAELSGDSKASKLLSEFLGTAGAVGMKRLTDLALTLKAEAEGAALRMVKSSIDAVIASVERRRPDFASAAAPDGTVTIVFSDMEGFSSMTERLGDREAHEVIKAHNKIVRSELKAHGGKEVELQGDGFLLAFASAARALRCAIAIQRACAAYNAEHHEEPIRVRIGLHTGQPIQEGDRFFGMTLILAARIAAQAHGGEILTSSVVHELVAGTGEFAFDAGREAELKGLAGKHRMYAVLSDGAAPPAIGDSR